MNNDQEENAGEPHSANSPPRQLQPRIPPSNKASSTPPRYPPSAPQHSMQHYPSPFFPNYQQPSGSPSPSMYQQYGASPSSSVPVGGGNGNPISYGYMPQQPYPPHGGVTQGGSPPSQSSMGNSMNSPSSSMLPPYGPSNAGIGDPLAPPQHGHPPPQHYSYHPHHQPQQQQPWNYGAPYSGMSPSQSMPYSVYNGGGSSAHDGMPPPPQPYGYNNWHHQPPPPYYQGWNGMHQVQPHHLGNPPEQSMPIGTHGDAISSEVSSENKAESANQQQQQHQGAKRSRPISQEMLKSVTAPTKPPDGTQMQPPKSPSEIQSSQREEIETMGCTCKKTNCLKLYCQCFAIKIYCGNNCRCSDCFNMPDYEAKRQEAMATIMSRNPVAFAAKYKKDKVDMAAHRLGCKCRKSACLKKYCECFAGGVNCSKTCRCVGCKNLDGKAARQMQALERAQLLERQRQKNQQPFPRSVVPPRGVPPGHPQPPMQPPLQPYYPPHPPHQYPNPVQYPPPSQQYPQQSPQHQYPYQPPLHHGNPPPHSNMPNYNYGPPSSMSYTHPMPMHPSSGQQQASPDQQGAPTGETSWDAAQSLTFLKRSSPGSNSPDKESNDLRMAAAMALTGFGQSPSAPPATNSLLTPIRQQQDESEESDIDTARAKRSINFYEDDDRGITKRQNTEDYTRGDDETRRYNDENNKYGQGVYGRQGQNAISSGTHHIHHRQHQDRNNDRVEGPEGPAEVMVATEVAYV